MTEMTVRAQKAAGGMLALTASAHFLNDMIQSVIPASIRCHSGEYTLSENYVHGLATFGPRLKNFESPHSSRGSSPGLPAGNSVISSAFSAILVCALDLKPGKTGMVSGLFFVLSFGLGGIAAAAFGWLADVTDLKTVFVIASFTPLLGAVALFLPKEAGHDAAVQMQRSR